MTRIRVVPLRPVAQCIFARHKHLEAQPPPTMSSPIIPPIFAAAGLIVTARAPAAHHSFAQAAASPAQDYAARPRTADPTAPLRPVPASPPPAGLASQALPRDRCGRGRLADSAGPPHATARSLHRSDRLAPAPHRDCNGPSHFGVRVPRPAANGVLLPRTVLVRPVLPRD